MFANFLISALIATLDVVNATPSCDIYHSVSNPDNCLSGDCGSCFNPGARPGVLCRGQQTGYYCSASSPSAGADMAFACMDWTFGSQAMLAAEASWNARSGEAPVYFGVGTYGTGSDPIRGDLGSKFFPHRPTYYAMANLVIRGFIDGGNDNTESITNGVGFRNDISYGSIAPPVTYVLFAAFIILMKAATVYAMRGLKQAK